MDVSGEDTYPIVAVVGALGTQGTSVIAALVGSPLTANWRIRALTSSPDSAAAKALSSYSNVSIVQCNVNDPASIRGAFCNCTHIFANTAFYGPTLLSGGAEAAEKLEHIQAMNLVRAAAATEGLRHLVFSTLLDPGVTSCGEWRIPHFSSEQGANAFITGGYAGDQLVDVTKEEGWGILRHKSSLMCVGMYGSNLFWDSYRPRKKDGTNTEYVIRLPCPSGAPFAVAGDEKTNVGLVVRAIFERPEQTLGAWVSCEAEKLSCREWVGALNSAASSQGIQALVVFEECCIETFEKKWGVVGTEAGQMFQYIGDMREKSFLNTSGLPEVSLQELGVVAVREGRLFPLHHKNTVNPGPKWDQQLFNHTDCMALFRSGDDDKPLLGTIGARN